MKHARYRNGRFRGEYSKSVDEYYDTHYKEGDDRIRAAIARGEKESLLSYILSHPGETLSCAWTSVWMPEGLWGAAIGGVIGLVVYLMIRVNALFLIPIGFIIAWGRDFWIFITGSWITKLQIDDKRENS